MSSRKTEGRSRIWNEKRVGKGMVRDVCRRRSEGRGRRLVGRGGQGRAVIGGNAMKIGPGTASWTMAGRTDEEMVAEGQEEGKPEENFLGAGCCAIHGANGFARSGDR